MAASKDAGNTQGDVNSTVAAALVAAKLQIPLALGAAAGLAAVALEKGFAFVTLHRPIERRPSWQTRVAAGGAGRDRAKEPPRYSRCIHARKR